MNNLPAKSTTDKRIAGVAGGIAEAYDLDPSLVRLAFVLFTFLGGPGVVIYIVLALVMPENNYGDHYVEKSKNEHDDHTSVFVG